MARAAAKADAVRLAREQEERKRKHEEERLPAEAAAKAEEERLAEEEAEEAAAESLAFSGGRIGCVICAAFRGSETDGCEAVYLALQQFDATTAALDAGRAKVVALEGRLHVCDDAAQCVRPCVDHSPEIAAARAEVAELEGRLAEWRRTVAVATAALTDRVMDVITRTCTPVARRRNTADRHLILRGDSRGVPAHAVARLRTEARAGVAPKGVQGTIGSMWLNDEVINVSCWASRTRRSDPPTCPRLITLHARRHV
ncbi:MAG: hypothetical protein CBD00_06525 [Rhodospirillaceae bacterium TMED140]|nr:MAG: hypothetical protein CBD00_06525 [Rhodospirillaceae bacterium TMED140]